MTSPYIQQNDRGSELIPSATTFRFAQRSVLHAPVAPRLGVGGTASGHSLPLRARSCSVIDTFAPLGAFNCKCPLHLLVAERLCYPATSDEAPARRKSGEKHYDKYESQSDEAISTTSQLRSSGFGFIFPFPRTPFRSYAANHNHAPLGTPYST